MPTWNSFGNSEIGTKWCQTNQWINVTEQINKNGYKRKSVMPLLIISPEHEIIPMDSRALIKR